jgi:phage N-6-adenine-methyltransferase
MAEGKWAVQHSSERMDWATPQSLFAWLDAEFIFVLDAAATADNTKCGASFISPEDDALSHPIGAWVQKPEWAPDCYQPSIWLNPPYGRGIGQWVKRAALEAQAGATVVVLTFACTDTKWWADAWKQADEIRFLTGRVHFKDPTGRVKAAAPKGSALLIFRPVRQEGAPVVSLVTPPR